MKSTVSVFLLSIAMGLLAGTARASEHAITVALDEGTGSDLTMLATSMAASTPGAAASKSLRKLAMGVAGEVDLLLHRRIGSALLLTLDDGNTLGMQQGDTVRVRFASHPGVEVSFGNCSFDGARERCKLSQIAVLDAGGSVRRLLSFGFGPPEKICGGTACN